MTIICSLLAFLLGFFLSRQLYLVRLAIMSKDVEKLRQDMQTQIDINNANVSAMQKSYTVVEWND
jgi:hypothetical protein